MQTCLLGRGFTGDAAALGIFKPKGGGNTEKKEREREGRKEAILIKKQLCAGHEAKDFALTSSFKLYNLFIGYPQALTHVL